MTNHSLRNEKITAFVRDVLGCGCPDEVFNKIEISNVELDPDMATAIRIVIGDTLLIYILPNTPVAIVTTNIGKLIAAGKQDRDLHGYNRFRLVLHSYDNQVLEENILGLFSAIAAKDAKLHLHFVEADTLAALG